MALKHTREIRAIMRKYGAIRIYTNKHKTCRSIKCYQGDIKYRGYDMDALLDELRQYVIHNGLIGVYTFNRKNRFSRFMSPASITVRIPNKRFTATSIPNRPAMLVTDNVTSKQITVPLYAYRETMRVLNALVGEGS